VCEVLDQLASQGRLRVPVVTDENAMAAAFDAVETEFGGLDVVVNTAGVTLLSPITPLDLADRDRINNLAKATPLERLDRAEDIVEAAAFLAAQLGRGGGIPAEHRQVVMPPMFRARTGGLLRRGMLTARGLMLLDRGQHGSKARQVELFFRRN